MRLVMATGWSLDRVVSLDVLTFNSLVFYMTKARYFDKAEDAWTTAMAVGTGMSGDSKALKERTTEWLQIGEQDVTKSLAIGKKTAGQFLSDFKLTGGGKV